MEGSKSHICEEYWIHWKCDSASDYVESKTSRIDYQI